jgi:two-component system phosphate regulon response regulator PhoB
MTPRRILIVDDDESVRSLLRMTMPEGEYEVEEATDGEEVLALLGGRVPDLVLLDWKMPGRHGSLVLDELKSRHPQLPVIVLTAEIAEHHRSLAEALKVDVFLTKPFSPLELLATIERLLGERPLDEVS